MNRFTITTIVFFSLIISSCPIPSSSEETYSVIYKPNSADSGTVCIDGKKYNSGDTVTIAECGTLGKTGYLFVGWSTYPDGIGELFNPGDSLVINESDVILYAIW